jgi:hypothetical protein
MTTLAESEAQLNDRPLCLCGDGELLDERSQVAFELLKEKATATIKVKYIEDLFHLLIDGTAYKITDFFKYFIELSYRNIIIEATTLTFVEILYILQAAKENSNIENIQILYIEPQEYKFKNNSFYTYDDFELSEQLKAFPPVPKFTINVEEKKVPLVAFLGFEQARIGQIFSTDEAAYDAFYPIVPLPGFLPGWENRTINNHLKFFTSKYTFQSLKYVSANNPYDAYVILDKFAISNKKFRVAPIGTKPNAIGCAVFLINQYDNEDINCGVLFDFPVKSKKRSSGIGKIHIYNINKI